jgi:hypothetical protein
MFTHTQDQAIERWETPEGEYAVAYDDSPTCPAGDLYSGHNCARRDSESNYWLGDTSVLHGPYETASMAYGGSSFTAAASTKEEAEFVVTLFAHWAEGHVYVVGFESTDGDAADYIHGVYTETGFSPDLAEVKSYFE